MLFELLVRSAGKTTVLRDIAGYSLKSITSTGIIELPNIPIVFCSGSISINPPATTLFEKITYRLPTEYTSRNKETITTRISELLTTLKQ